jgi:hypothetical protein
MTDRRINRAGPAFPETVIIRSAPYQPLNKNSIDLHPFTGTLDPPPPERVTWHEWNINPAKHGPERLTRPPVFVPASNQYDELGRSLGDGVGVEVDEGVIGKGRELENGEMVAEWYRALASRPLDLGTPGAGPSRPVSPRRVLPNNANNPVDLTGSPSPSPSPSPSLSTSNGPLPILPSTPLETPSAETQNRPVRVKKSEWFIRRALLRKPQLESKTTTPPPPISTLLNIPIQPRVPSTRPAKYVIGPENAGYAMLDRLGWQGGGLGRPEGWDANSNTERSPIPIPNDVTVVPEISLDIHGNPIIDLVLSDSEVESESEEELRLEPIRSGPGRTAPISTALKLDRLGLGRRTMEKKVTHSAAEIEKAQRRAKFVKSGKVESGEMGKKAKIRMKEKERREREERRRIQAALND